jgi:hypothetical protein
MLLYKIYVEMGNNNAKLNITNNAGAPLGSFNIDSSPGSVDNVVNQIKQINPAGSYTGIQGQASAQPAEASRSWFGWATGQPAPSAPVQAPLAQGFDAFSSGKAPSADDAKNAFSGFATDNAPIVDPFIQPFVPPAPVQAQQQGLAMQPMQVIKENQQAPSAPSAQAQVKAPAPVARQSVATLLSQYPTAVPVDSPSSIPAAKKNMFSSFWGNKTIGGTRRRRAKKTVAQRKKRRKSVRFMGMKYY